MNSAKNYAAYGRSFFTKRQIFCCSPECRGRVAVPAVYRFIAPDGRSYVGGVFDSFRRGRKFARSNSRLLEAFEKHPPETWTYEVLELLPPNKSWGVVEYTLRTAEQRHINRLRTWDPEHGFNICPAYLEIADEPALRAFKEFKKEVIRTWREARPAQVRDHVKGGKAA